ncbi:hypothetical protein SAMN05216247_103497 [Pseudomonas salomonii]|uniref:Uncharacterized protein n=1 Tax=Pseudomonas salomonii TaxID=191391 RepID=A0A1H3J8N6_9PSED|nr:hypothetical protein SAMN05216247_103497 [Pseudomonas salomonii]
MKDPRDQDTFELFGFTDEEKQQCLNTQKKKPKRNNSKCEI